MKSFKEYITEKPSLPIPMEYYDYFTPWWYEVVPPFDIHPVDDDGKPVDEPNYDEPSPFTKPDPHNFDQDTPFLDPELELGGEG